MGRGHLTWKSPDDKFSLSVWGKNITDSVTFMAPYLQVNTAVGKSWYPPATYGITGRVNF